MIRTHFSASRLVAITLLATTLGLSVHPADAAPQVTISVTDSGDVVADDGACTLREAITAANANIASGAISGECAAGVVYDSMDSTTRDLIAFALPGAGPTFTITPGSALPAITEAVEIDGTTQTGADCSSWPPTLDLILDGSTLVGSESGLLLQGG